MSIRYEPVGQAEAVFDSADVAAVNAGQESLLPRPPSNYNDSAAGAIQAVVASAPTVQVTAPADLPEGFVFQASLGGEGNRVISVTVPPGGIEKGQTFAAPLPTEVESIVTGTVSIPVGHWRDGLFTFWSHGICHAHCWTACCCTTLATGQVMSRLKLSWTGLPPTSTKPGASAGTFAIILGIVCLYYAVRCALQGVLIYLDPVRALDDEDDPEYQALPPASQTYETVTNLIGIWFWLFWAIMAVLLMRVRRTVREKYAIPTKAGDAEDCLVASFCPCFAAGQLLRHTTDYNIYPSTCCTERGIPSHAPSIV